ncbi:DUF5777 family beta-barrel protein [Mucilaginibacter sp. RS28]|uniref:DUF5777 family beta-barrel protein n=1 Tax=Mucilaginibacter straminoryzae TaxID=2932774 RepID=A0A9X2BE35_9SPHI|nr:DUF5777 family beta-barrel protein [Mucilaginibacter straminoryzae]MCJ8210993.1 DUF5777 family beta-barrel protein [Mucilaginibacter straminoryzae]
MKIKLLAATVLLLAMQQTYAQKTAKDSSSTDSLMKSLSSDDKAEPVTAAFKSTMLILTPTTETIKKKNLNFMVVHRFGDIAGSQGGGKTLWGLDNSSDIYIGFEYGLTDNLDIDFGRSKYEQLINLGLKYNFLQQTTDGSVPVAMTIIGQTGLKPYHVTTTVFDDYTNRLNYFAQLILSRKFSSRLSLEVAPSFTRNNLPYPFLVGNGNNIFSLTAAGRLKLTKRMGVVVDYVHPFSHFRRNSNSPKFYNPLGVGIEMETGGHVFTLNFTNAQAISPMNYISDTESSWTKGQYRLGFTITRVFDLNGKHKGTYK